MCMCYENNCKHKRVKKISTIKQIAEQLKFESAKKINEDKEREQDEFRKRVGNRCLSARKMAGLSLDEACKLFEWTKQNLHKYEQGKYSFDSTTLIKFSNAYKLPVDFFLRKNTIEFGEIKFFNHKIKF